MMDLHEQFGMILGEVSRAWRDKLNERLRPLGLTQAKWVTLLHLARCKHGLIQTELAARLGIEGPTLVRLLDSLEKDGWIRRQHSEQDRRTKIVELGEGAKPVLKKIRKVIRTLRAESLSGIPDEDIAASLAVLGHIKDRLDSI